MRALTRGAIKESLFDILNGTNKPEKDAEETQCAILAEFERLGGRTIEH